MASAMRKMAVYLGLVEDDHRYQDKYDTYGEYEDYDDQADRAEPADEVDAEVGVKRDGEVSAGYVGYQGRLAHRARVPDDRSRTYHDTASSHLQ